MEIGKAVLAHSLIETKKKVEKQIEKLSHGLSRGKPDIKQAEFSFKSPNSSVIFTLGIYDVNEAQEILETLLQYYKDKLDETTKMLEEL